MDDLSKDELLERQTKYWAKQEASINGMLGGYGHITDVDIAGSQRFLDQIMPASLRQGRVLDCGAGIGRVAKGLLLPAGFYKVDLLDVSATFLEKARLDLMPSGRLGRTFCSGLAEFDFGMPNGDDALRWRLIWVQWCIIYLTDVVLVDFFRRAAGALTDDGLLVVKENTFLEDEQPTEDARDRCVSGCA